MKTYLVGGAVRDELLGLPQHDRDYVIVGATQSDIEEMLAQGYKPVGKDFPVFLHPVTDEEYALARVERKTGPGYHGFEFQTAPEVSLEEDLARRDLSINAMARDETGALIDPYGGKQDLEQRILRHVSDAFAEDPVRILRVARFMARWEPLGFKVAENTRKLIQTMVAKGEVASLVPERVWAETSKALKEPSPFAFVRTLRKGGALAVLFPEIDSLYTQQVDRGGKPFRLERVMNQIAKSYPGDDLTGFCVLTYQLEKKAVVGLSERLKVPSDYANLARLTSQYYLAEHQILESTSEEVLALLKVFDAIRRPERLEPFLKVCWTDWQDVHGKNNPYPQADFLRAAQKAVASISAVPFVEQGLKGIAVGEAVNQARLEAIEAVAGQRATNRPHI